MRIVIAEDSLVEMKSLTLALEKWGYEVVACTNGKEALQVLTQEDPPKLVLLDWKMPEINGLEVCQELRFQQTKDYLYIIILSSNTEQKDRIKGLQSGADDYIQKPIDLQELQLRLQAGRRILELQENLLEAQKALRIQATHDFLTGIHNRAAIMGILNQEINRTRRCKNPVGVLMADIDTFKNINDTHGHPAGDAVIKEVANRIQDSLREYDHVGRFGGEEFLIVVPEIQHADLHALANRIRKAIADTPMDLPLLEITVTLSIGGALLNRSSSCTINELIAQSDEALYQAKEGGRNRVEMAPEPVSIPIPIPIPEN